MENLSFKALIGKYNVVIPMLQRDYAYGRMPEKEKRENFLRNIKTYFENSSTHELDFIYGSVDADGIMLKLLDGQQRVTTLFLLHWYLSLIKDAEGKHHFSDFKEMMLSSNGESKFTYKTRFSSSDFCNAIVSLQFNGVDYVDKYVEAVANEKINISAIIKKEKWFLPHWNYDPTINSMLNMIDSIKTFFPAYECKEYYHMLVDDEKIVFNFLNLEDFSLTDKLYIKMNSRGRALTRFENLKSKLLMLYDEAEKVVPNKYNEKLNQIQDRMSPVKTLRDYVSYMLDTKWTDVFWSERINAQNDETPNVDNMLLSFITVIGIFEHILFKLQGRLTLNRSDELTKEINELMSDKDENKGITIPYERLLELFKENNYGLLFKIIDYFDIFNDNGKRKSYLPPDFALFSEKEYFRDIVDDYKKKMEYEKKAKFFAYVKYLSENPSPNEQHLNNWMRFVCNVCSNSYSLPNYTDTFCSAIAALNYLYDENIVASLPKKDLSSITTLDKSQIEEEILKMKLSCNPSWKEALIDAESKLVYFEGRLSFPLFKCCNVSEKDITNTSKINDFKDYIKKIASIFPDKDGCRFEKELIRAMLAKGDYLLYFKRNNSLLKNADRDNSWRRFLKEDASGANIYYRPYGWKNEDLRNYFKAILDEPDFDSANAEDSLKKIANERNEDIPIWRKLLIDYPEIFDNTDVRTFGSDRYMRWNIDSTEFDHKKDCEDNYEIDLIPGSAITGYHAELFSLCKYFELKREGFPGNIVYQTTMTTTEQPYFYLKKEEQICVHVLYQDDNCFRFIYYNQLGEQSGEETDIQSSEVAAKLSNI